jgi:hypothetical protein
MRENLPFSLHLVSYEQEASLHLIPENVLSVLRSCDFILQTPMFYPDTPNLIQKLQSAPPMECLGEYGFLESSWFHPRTHNRSLGLHFLEKGILTRPIDPAEFQQIENRELLHLLFHTTSPTSDEVAKYKQNHRFYLCYLNTAIGGAVYLHALLKAHEKEDKGIDLCLPDLGWFMQYAELQTQKKKPLIEGGFLVAQIEIYVDGKRCVIPTGKKGKSIRLICPSHLKMTDFRKLLSLSDEFVGVRGNQSFSEAIAANKVFFYDGKEHARYFLKDLIAIAQNRLQSSQGAVDCFQGMGEAFRHNLSEQTDKWVDEVHFQESADPLEIAYKIGEALQKPDTIRAYKKFNEILAKEYSANSFILHLVQRAFCHQRHPEIAHREAEKMNAFGEGEISFSELVESMRAALHSAS